MAIVEPTAAMDQAGADLTQLFLDDTYSIESLLAKTRQSNLSLKQLREQLIQHQQQLNQTSIELFDSSYDRFYKLSYLIACLAEPIQRLAEPVQCLHERLKQVCNGHQSYVAELSQKLKALEDTNLNKNMARILSELIKRRDSLETLFVSIDWSLKATDRESRYGNKEQSAKLQQQPLRSLEDIEHSIKCDLLERANVQLYYLSCEVSAVEPTDDKLVSMKKSLEAQLAERQRQLDTWFESTFLEAIELKDKPLIDLIVHTYKQKNCCHRLDTVWRSKVFRPIAASLEANLNNQPLSEIPQCTSNPDDILSKFRLKICMHVYVLVIKCLSPDMYVEALEVSFSQLICRIINRFADWLSKLRLSDFRITSSSTDAESSRQTNFLAKQDAIMRLLIEDCARLTDLINDFIDQSDLQASNKRLVELRKELIGESLKEFNNGLNNVKNLQRLIER